MNTVQRKRRLVNPGKRKRMSLKQKLHFGTKRVRAAAAKALSRSRTKRKNYGTTKGRSWSHRTPVAGRPRAKAKRRRNTGVRRSTRSGVLSNIGEIITVGLNPGGGRTMARRRKKRALGIRRRRRVTRRRNPRRSKVYVMNPRRRRRRTVGVRGRRRNYSKRRRNLGRRRNPSMIGTYATSVLGVVGGAAATKLVSDRLPFNLSVGIPGYISTAVVAMLLGWAVGKFGKNIRLGEMMTLGGFTYLGLKLMGDFFPSLASLSPFGLRGMGVIGPSSFYAPQVNRPGSMGSFITPAAVSAAMPAPLANAANLRGLGLARRTGRLM